jgi:hypothetical protein
MKREMIFDLVFGALFIVIGIAMGMMITPECPDCFCPRCNCPDCTCQEQQKCTQIHISSGCQDYEFINMAKEVAAAHNYSQNYDCANYTIDMVNLMHKNNYEAHFIYGDAFNLTDDKTHAFTKICLYIESTTGEILTPKRFIENNYTIFETDPEWARRYMPIYY